MTKKLTEQWKDGELYSGVYYCKTKSLGIKKLYLHHKAYGGMYADTYSQEEHYPDEDIEEILAPVPRYYHFSQLVKKVEHLEEQLNEANEVIKKYMAVAFEIRNEEEKPTVLQLAFDYLEKWGVK